MNQQLGVWSSFALQECQQDQNSHIQYWKKQNTVIKHFIQKYKTLPDSNTLINRVSHIAESLQIVATNGLADKDKQQMIACNNIKQLALYSIQGL